MPQLWVKFLFSQLEDEKRVTQKCRQGEGEGCFQHNLGFNGTLAEPQAGGPHVSYEGVLNL